MVMEEVSGSLGTRASLFLRFGQTVCSTSALLTMCADIHFYRYTACCFLVLVMGLVVPWSTTLIIGEACCLLFQGPLRQRGITILLIFVDWVLAFLSLAAASSTAGVAQILLTPPQGPACPVEICGGYLVSASIAFLSWFLLSTSVLFNLSLLPKLNRRN